MPLSIVPARTAPHRRQDLEHTHTRPHGGAAQALPPTEMQSGHMLHTPSHARSARARCMRLPARLDDGSLGIAPALLSHENPTRVDASPCLSRSWCTYEVLA